VAQEGAYPLQGGLNRVPLFSLGLVHSVILTFIYCSMTPPKKKNTRKKASKKKGLVFISVARLSALLFLLIILVFSVCTVGYVIFFRTVLTQEMLPGIRSAIVFEEPNPPVDLEPPEGERFVQVAELPEVAIIIIDDIVSVKACAASGGVLFCTHNGSIKHSPAYLC
jgi:hypothetical protein